MPRQIFRQGIGRSLAVLFVAMLVIGASAIFVAENAFDKHAELARLVNQTGRLRMLSQSIAYSAHREAQDRATAARETDRLVDEFEKSLATIAEDASPADAPALGAIRVQWQGYLAAVRRARLGGSAALADVDIEAARMLDSEEAAIRLILARHADLRHKLRFDLIAVLLLGLGLTATAYWRIRAGIVEPVRRMVGMARRFAAGDHDARVGHYPHDELGELAAALDGTAVATQQLLARHRAAEQAIQDSELRHRTLWETSTDAIIMIDAGSVIRHCNPAVQAIFGYAPDELLGRDISMLQPERLRAAHRRGFERYQRSGTPTLNWQSIETHALHRDGHEVPVELSFTHMKLTTTEWFAAFFRDVSRRTEALAALRLRDRAIESTGEGIMISDALAPDHPTLYVNPAFGRITGYAPEEVLGRNGRFFLGDGIDQPEAEALRHLLRERRDGSVVLRCYHKDGSPFWNELSVSPVRDADGRVSHTISIFKDITERKRQEEELLRNAHHDTLTGLANRALLHDRLTQAISVAARHGRRVGALFVDLDNFKLINDSLGHEAGDALIVETARRLDACLREGDTAARIGGDEFVLLLADMEHEEDIALVAERVLATMLRPFHTGGHDLYVSASVGASVYPRDGADSQTLIKHADIAMYRAKEHGRNNFQVFTAEMQSRIDRRLSLETHLRKALERDEFEVFYQPQVNLESGAVVGAEALIRWRHGEMGMISPAQFIPLAEETGLIVPIGEWVLDAVCGQVRAWLDGGQRPLTVAINLSARQFRQQNLLRVIEQSLRLQDLPAALIEIELTESMVMQDPEQTIRILRDMKELGLSVSLDDFGTGYSSLSHLRRFPIDVLKVDQSFVRDITTSKDDAAIAASIIALAHSLQLAVVAEGVETQAQLHHLRQLRCDLIQGYYFSKPLPAADFGELLAAGRRLDADDMMPADNYVI